MSRKEQPVSYGAGNSRGVKFMEFLPDATRKDLMGRIRSGFPIILGIGPGVALALGKP